MRGKKAAVTLFAALCITAVLQVGALAHSTYVWYTAARPYHVIPFTFVLSVALEYAALVCIAHAARGSRTLIIVLIGNVLAFGVGGAYYIRSNWGRVSGPVLAAVLCGANFPLRELCNRGTARGRRAEKVCRGKIRTAHLDVAPGERRHGRYLRPG